jgi:anti-anti-sigma factor
VSQVVPEAAGGSFVYGPEAGQWWWSDGVCELLGLERDTVPSGEVLAERETTPAAGTVQRAVEQCLTDGTAFVLMSGLDTAQSQSRWVVWTADRVDAADGLQVAGHVFDITTAFQQALSEQTMTHLDAALASRQHIDLAKGALMLAYGVDAEAAFDLLVWTSQRSNVRVHDLAQRLTVAVADGTVADSDVRAGLESALVEQPDEPRPGPGRRPAKRLSVRHSNAGGARIVAVRGALDLGTGPEFSSALGEQLESLSPGEVLIVDLTEVDYLGLVGLSVLESIGRRGRSVGIDLHVVAYHPVHRLLNESTHLKVRALAADGRGSGLDRTGRVSTASGPARRRR